MGSSLNLLHIFGSPSYIHPMLSNGMYIVNVTLTAENVEQFQNATHILSNVFQELPSLKSCKFTIYNYITKVDNGYS